MRRRLLLAAPLLALALSACGQSAPFVPLAPRAAVMAQGTSLPQLEQTYRALDWTGDAARKGQLLLAIARTGSDAAASFLLGEYRATTWRTADRKLSVVSALDALVLQADKRVPASGMQAADVVGPSLTALSQIAETLQGDAQVPAADQPEINQVLGHIGIVAPHTSR